MSANQFEAHAERKSSNLNEHIMRWGQSLYHIVHTLKLSPKEGQLATLQRMKTSNKGYQSTLCAMFLFFTPTS